MFSKILKKSIIPYKNYLNNYNTLKSLKFIPSSVSSFTTSSTSLLDPPTESIALLKSYIDEAKDLSTIRDFIRFISTRLSKSEIAYGHGTNDSYEEAIYLLSFYTRLTPSYLEILADSKLTSIEKNEILNLLLERIEKRKPTAYLTNSVVLNDLLFYCDPRVLIPRSLLAEPLQSSLSSYIAPESVNSVLDLCTGSGSLAVLAANCFPNSKVTAVDISADALEVANKNVTDHGLLNRIELVRSDMFSALPKVQYDVILCNPPYVETEAVLNLPKEYSYEPKIALDGGADGMDFVHVVMRTVYGYLSNNGILLLEIGGLKDQFLQSYPDIAVEWVNTSQGYYICFQCIYY